MHILLLANSLVCGSWHRNSHGRRAHEERAGDAKRQRQSSECATVRASLRALQSASRAVGRCHHGATASLLPTGTGRMFAHASTNRTVFRARPYGCVSWTWTTGRAGSGQTEIAGDVVNVVDDILSEAVQTGISDIHIEIFKEAAQIRFRGNGSMLVQTQYRSFITKNYNAVIARIKILANLDIAERRLPQDGKISYQAKDGTEVDFRISILPTSLGERVVIRILNSSSLAVTISALGFTKKQEDEFIKTVEAPQGMVLVTGPTGSGKSTTLYGQF